MINIAELLKDVPIGTKLYSPLFGEVEFCAVDSADNTIVVKTEHGDNEWFSSTGKYKINKGHFLYSNSECLLFPSKNCRNWEGWKVPVKSKFKVWDWVVTDYGKVSQVVSVDNDGDGYTLDDGVYFSGSWCDMYHLWTIEDAKDGDVLAADECYVIFKEIDGLNIKCYCTYHYMGFNPRIYMDTLQNKDAFKPATKEQRDTLFAKIRESGYEWDADKKGLRKIKSHYDIANFKPFNKVLVRDRDIYKWKADYFSHYAAKCMFSCVGSLYKQCIPFDGNEHLLGTTDMCDECYINW